MLPNNPCIQCKEVATFTCTYGREIICGAPVCSSPTCLAEHEIKHQISRLNGFTQRSVEKELERILLSYFKKVKSVHQRSKLVQHPLYLLNNTLAFKEMNDMNVSHTEWAIKEITLWSRKFMKRNLK